MKSKNIAHLIFALGMVVGGSCSYIFTQEQSKDTNTLVRIVDKENESYKKEILKEQYLKGHNQNIMKNGNAIPEEDKKYVAAVLSKYTNIPQDELLKKINDTKAHVLLAENIPSEAIDLIKLDFLETNCENYLYFYAAEKHK